MAAAISSTNCVLVLPRITDRWAARPFYIIWFTPDLFLLHRLGVDGLVFRPHQLLSVGLLDRLFHANSVEDQLKLLDNLGRVARDKGSHDVIGEQLSKIAFGIAEIDLFILRSSFASAAWPAGLTKCFVSGYLPTVIGLSSARGRRPCATKPLDLSVCSDVRTLTRP